MNKDRVVGMDVVADLRAVFTKYGYTKTIIAFIAETMEISIDEADKRWDEWMEDTYYFNLFNPIIAGDDD